MSLSSTLAPNISDCSVTQANGTSNDPPDDWFYTHTMSSFMETLVDTVGDETIKAMGKIMVDPHANQSLMKDALMDNGAVLFIFILLILISVALTISVIVVAACRWFCPKKEGLSPSGGQMFCTLLSFALCGLLCVSGVALFLVCINTARDSIVKIPKQLNTTSMNLGVFVKGYGENMNCIFGNEKHKLLTDIGKASTSLKGVINEQKKLLNTTFIDDVQQKIQDIGANVAAVQKLLGAADTSFATSMKTLTDSKLVTDMDGMRNDMAQLEILLDRSADTSNITARAKELSAEQNQLLTNVVDQITEKTEELQEMMKKGISNEYYSEVSFYLQFTTIIPFALFVLICGGFVFLTLRFFGNCCADEVSDKGHPKRGIISSLAGHILGIGGYMSMITGALLFAMAATGFAFAFASMFLCVGLFHDPDLRFFQAISQFDQKQNMGGMEIKISMHDTFVKCKNGYTFFDAIDGNYNMARKHVKSELEALLQNTLFDDITKFAPPAHVEKSIEDAQKIVEDQLQSSSELMKLNALPTPSPLVVKMVDDLKVLRDKLQIMSEMINNLSSRARMDDMTSEIDESLKQVETAIVESIASTLPPSYDVFRKLFLIMVIWDDIGDHICTEITTPLQGIWFALVISGVASFTVCHHLFKSTLYLKDFSEPSSKKDTNEEDSDKPRKKKKSTSHPIKKGGDKKDRKKETKKPTKKASASKGKKPKKTKKKSETESDSD